MISVTVRYRTSTQKWNGIKEFAEKNGIDTKNIDAMIARINRVGDVELKKEIVFKICNIDDLWDAIHSTEEHPCPHCHETTGCGASLLWGEDAVCCKEWDAVREQFLIPIEDDYDE